MSSVDWEEVKRLAADFQKAQLSSTLQKLSERNCIEIITTLVENKLLDIIFTNDGKEYVTPQHLGKEIKDELYIHGGKISLVDLAQILNVNLSQITKAVTEIEKHNKGLKVILGQLIDKSYISKIAEEINDKLVQHGCINVAELTLIYNLPSDFLLSVVEKELGKIIHAIQDSQDPKIFYTESFIARNKAKIKGALSAITKPTPLSAILGQCGVPERIFFSILDSLQEVKQVPGVVTGKQSGNSIYIPTIYSKSQNEWVENFYKQNGYLEYDALTRLGISDPSGFVKRHFPNENMVFLKSVAVGTVITDQVDANIEEVVATGSFIDLYPLLPSVFSDKDAELVIKLATKKIRVNVHIFAKTVIVSEAFLQTLTKSLETVAEQKTRDMVGSGRWIQSIAENKLKSKSADLILESKVNKKEERRKKASIGKAGGGSQGRETKTKSTKKKYLQGKIQENDSDQDETRQTAVGRGEITVITVEEVKTEVMKDENVAVIEEMADELACYLQPKLNKFALTLAEQLAQSNKTTNLSEIGKCLNILITNIRIFDKGIKHLDKADQAPLTKYLLKTLGIDFVTSIFKLAAQQNMLQVAENLTTETRQRLLLELPADVKEPLSVIHKTVMGDSVEDFLNNADRAMAACCLVLKKYDKKKERPQIHAHREALLEELNATQDPALTLHLVTSVLFTAVTQNALHMSGRHVTTVLAFLQQQLEPNTMSTLSTYHDLVLNLLNASNENAKIEAFRALEEGLVDIKNIANNFKQHIKIDKS
ncbi:E3 UFM1-protein ligase 1 like protein [Trachymyrmex septentrionalis]|uniref:E3 UFM1-protein ligase 1 homolog n=1 Tax=Trachymyrmex septentrionalis TaxID=34720 RepID=A0A195F7F9_9HYME|nr:PREDICTED: E3 UFM1-protein ligase 1 homolog [Trachymyrmex septentrionalis]KYN36004.1 E3 UFM1-protein ligase 1 like protein [Trachymyrmex septentrionalis]